MDSAQFCLTGVAPVLVPTCPVIRLIRSYAGLFAKFPFQIDNLTESAGVLMSYRKAFASMVLLCILSAPAKSQTPNRNRQDVYDHVLDLLFPVDVESKPYYAKLILRFHDDESQLVLVVYPGGESELIHSSLDNMNGSSLFQLVTETLARNPAASESEIAARVKVRTIRSPLEHRAVQAELNHLKTIRISPYLATRVGVDEVTWYEFWFDSGQESVHYKIFGDSAIREPQDKLAHWMTTFRANSQTMLKRKS
jgi:hypothetical protein